MTTREGARRYRNVMPLHLDALQKVWDCLSELAWPTRCPACDTFVNREGGFCLDCQGSMLTLEGACARCSMPQTPGNRCTSCLSVPWPLDATICGAQYGGALVTALLKFKHGRQDLVRPLSHLLVAGISQLAPPDALVVPVPLHPRRLRKRGFNQALDLARFALKRLPEAKRPVLGPAVLERVRDSAAGEHLAIEQRAARAEGAFRVRRPASVATRDIVIVDDVLTTGATLRTCAEALLQAGANSVRAVTVARAV